MVPIMWKTPTKPWFLRRCLILGGRDCPAFSSAFQPIGRRRQAARKQAEEAKLQAERDVQWPAFGDKMGIDIGEATT